MKYTATGTFAVNLTPAPSDENVMPNGIGRMFIDKQFFGDLKGVSQGQMLSVMTVTEGSAGYVAIERVVGMIEGRQGSFMLQHFGAMTNQTSELIIRVVPDSATDGLAGLSGSMTINIEDGQHLYEFDYTLPAEA